LPLFLHFLLTIFVEPIISIDTGPIFTTFARFVPNYSVWKGGSVAEWLACWTQAQKARVQIAVATLSGNSLKHRAYFNVPTGTDVLGDLKSVLEGLVTRA